MDNSNVCGALNLLNMMYQGRYFSLGIARAYEDAGVRRRLSRVFRRHSIRRKAQALIAHDRVLTGR